MTHHMRDPHVEAVYYEIGSGEGISFGSPPVLALTNRLGTFELANGKLTICPTAHYASGEEARAVFDPFLRAWELDADLTRNIGSRLIGCKPLLLRHILRSRHTAGNLFGPEIVQVAFPIRTRHTPSGSTLPIPVVICEKLYT